MANIQNILHNAFFLLNLLMEIKKMFNARQIDYKQGEKVPIRQSQVIAKKSHAHKKHL